MEGLSTKRASRLLTCVNAWQSYANPSIAAGCMALHSPAKPIGSAVTQTDLVVGMWYITHLCNGCSAVKSASGAGAWVQMQWEMGLRVGSMGGGSDNKCPDSITTLGEGARGLITTLGVGALLKLSRWGVAWKRGRIRAGDDSGEAAGQGGGHQAETGNRG